MLLSLSTCEVRSWRAADASSLARHANSRKIWINLRDRFPHPYTDKDARTFLRGLQQSSQETFFAIAVDGAAAGGIGFLIQPDVERVSAEIGYWLGEAFWGRGIATEALTAVTRYAMKEHGLTRLFALPFANNAASCRVLEKSGYTLEGRLRRSAIKDGVILDQLQYACIEEERTEGTETSNSAGSPP
jgi:[ribosomal protein S5]-alanine N-acetyltransferase